MQQSSLPISPVRATTSIAPQPISTTDSFDLFLNTFLSQCRFSPMDIRKIPVDVDGLKTLAQYSAWKYVVDVSGRVLPNVAVADAGLVTRLRLEGLFRIKMFDELTIMATDLLTIEHNKGGGGDRCMIYSMRLLLAEIKTMTGQGEESFQLLYMFRHELQQLVVADESSGSSTLQWWIWRTCNSIINAAIRQRMWRIAVSELTAMLRDVRDTYARAIEKTPAIAEYTQSFRRTEIVVMCRLSRILLQIGAMKSSSLFFEQAKAIYQMHVDPLSAGGPTVMEDVSMQLEVTQALLLFGRDKYEEALSLFNTIIDKERSRRMGSAFNDLSLVDARSGSSSSSSSSSRSNWSSFGGSSMGFDGAICVEESVLAAAVNNYSICALYLRRIPEAIGRLEGLILEDPVRHMTDPVVFNLCTLYDLSCSPEISVMKKKVLQQFAAVYCMDDPVLHWRSFRLN